MVAELKKPLSERKKNGPQSIRATKARKERAIVDLVIRGTSPPVIKAAFDVDDAEIARIREKYSFIFKALKDGEVEDYQKVRGTVLTAMELQFAKSMMDPEKLERANVHNLAYALRETSHLRRLESGQSTENIATTFTKIIRKE